ncbi:DUF4336 domain-containing protein [Gilvimarinus xylanilyticus]|uniref:DUF4336 domain-containing protein n=1 Tax=Gilvimarinus xylanilyticus TaxID=2944139 RepID=A0A9X2KV87_9GAMM|nr:DUF4336 domain-containing protein [Gilvimarinus xylanilyticus]MCP8897810.1 DUF4336 domain-containing protein [Gilvimarinus xylanilyticus]
MTLQPIADELWIIDGPAVSFFGMPYTTRTTIARLPNGSLWVHSPGEINDALAEQLDALGQVCYLIAPNKIHHLFIEHWQKRYPAAESFAAPGLREKRPDLTFSGDLLDTPHTSWAPTLDQLIFVGSPVMQEVVFFHTPSRTLILTDLIENFAPDYFTGVKALAAKATGIVAPNGKMPLDWRLSFWRGKDQARRCLAMILAWQPERIVISHGECVFENAQDFLRRSFAWLKLEKF